MHYHYMHYALSLYALCTVIICTMHYHYMHYALSLYALCTIIICTMHYHYMHYALSLYALCTIIICTMHYTLCTIHYTHTLYSYTIHNTPQVAVPGIPGPGPGNVFAVHSSEIPYAMADARYLGAGAETSLSIATSGYWCSFAVTGDPNHASAPTVWPRYTEQGDEVLRLDEPLAGGVRVQVGVRKATCDFWDQHKGSA
jgi:hypothetical protein